MGDIRLNILSPSEIACLKVILDEVIFSLPKQQRRSELKLLVAEQLLNFAKDGEKDPIRLRENAFRTLHNVVVTTRAPASEVRQDNW